LPKFSFIQDNIASKISSSILVVAELSRYIMEFTNVDNLFTALMQCKTMELCGKSPRMSTIKELIDVDNFLLKHGQESRLNIV